MTDQYTRSYWTGVPGHTGPQIQVKDLQTVTPLTRAEYVGLLKTKPVKDWQAMTTFLHERHLILLPRAEFFPRSSAPQPSQEVEAADAARKAARILAHQERVAKQKADALERRKTKAAAAETRKLAEVKAAQDRKVARKATNDSREAAAQRRKSEAAKVEGLNPRDAFKGIKRAADAKLRLEKLVESEGANLSDHDRACLEQATQGLPPVVFARVDDRPVRPIVAPPTWSRSDSSAADSKVLTDRSWRHIQEAIRSCERHLSYLFHENWQVVAPKKRRPRNRLAKEVSTPTGRQ